MNQFTSRVGLKIAEYMTHLCLALHLCKNVTMFFFIRGKSCPVPEINVNVKYLCSSVCVCVCYLCSSLAAGQWAVVGQRW